MNDDANYGCTIIIPTYNRPRYLKRILSYYNKYAGNYNIIVADSSSDENKKLNDKVVSSFSNLNILYLSNYSSEISPYHKIVDSINYVDTKYCVLCADDDFVVPNGISQSVDFLEKNPDFAIAHGYYIRFHLKTDKKGKQQFCWIPIYLQKSNTSPDPKLRLYFNIAKFNPPFYAVHRTACLEMIFKESMKYTCDPRFDELLLSALPSIYGKMKRLNVFYAAREDIPTSGKYTYKTLEDYIKEGTYAEKYDKFRDCLVMHLSKMSQLDAKESKKLVDDAMSDHMKRKYLTVKMIGVLDYLRLPDRLDGEIRALYRRLFVPKMPTDEDIHPSYYDDFNKIRLQVLSFSKK